MQDKYIINQQLKRIEPKETLCQFCNKRHSTKMDRNSFETIFQVKERTELIVYSSVKFKKLKIGIPRCNHCYVIHQGSIYKAWGISFIIYTLLIILGFIIWGKFGVFSAIPLFILFFVTPYFLVDSIVKKKGILTKKEALIKDPLVTEMVISGWSLTPPI